MDACDQSIGLLVIGHKEVIDHCVGFSIGYSLLTGVFGAAKAEGRPDYYTTFPLGGGDRSKKPFQILEHLTGAQVNLGIHRLCLHSHFTRPTFFHI